MIWRALFVRLVPDEAYIPRFALPAGSGPVRAVLETIHRSGQLGGSPGSMLSSGNLNTAALTLFLALNLSVERRLPFIVLDDPVQSMDEMHVARFGDYFGCCQRGKIDRLLLLFMSADCLIT